MARRVGLTHNEVAHRWAQNTEDDHAAGHNMRFRGDTIYSYGDHFPIARHVVNSKGEAAVLFTTETYGTSTSQHCTITRRAINHLKVFDVPLVTEYFGTAQHARNVAYYQAQYDDIIERAERCSVHSCVDIEYTMREARYVIQQGADYCAFFDVDDLVVPALKVHLDWIAARWARLTSPEATAERERKAERRRELEARQHQTQIEAYCRGEIHTFKHGSRAAHLMTGEQVDRREAFEHVFYATRIAEWAAGAELERFVSFSGAISNSAPILTQSHAKHLASPEQLAERHAFELEAQKEQIAAWRNGEPRIAFGMGNKLPIMLRSRTPRTPNDPVTEIETSWGARFPADEARVALRYIQTVRRRGVTWHSNGEQAPKLGFYKIDKITGGGDVRAGCHLVPWSEIESLAIELGWIE